MTDKTAGAGPVERRLGPLPNRWRVVCVPGADPYFERCADGQWAQREQVETEIAAAVAAERERLKTSAEDAWRAGFDAGAIYGVAEDRYDPQRDPEHERPERPQNPYAA